MLVEASKDDCRWGIGSTKDDRMSWRCRTWRGYNWLGNILTETRNLLMTEVSTSSACVVLCPKMHKVSSLLDVLGERYFQLLSNFESENVQHLKDEHLAMN